MNMDEADQFPKHSVEVSYDVAWDIYLRLRELDVSCIKESYCPLQINLDTPTTVIQSWSVCRQFIEPKHVLVDWLNRCWSQSTHRLARK